jgi:hypothetical protein
VSFLSLLLWLQAAALGSSAADSLREDFRTYCLAGPSTSAAVHRLETDGWAEYAAMDESSPRFFARDGREEYSFILVPKRESPDSLASCVASNTDVGGRELVRSVSQVFGRPVQEGQHLVWPPLDSGVEIRASILAVNDGADGLIHLDLAASYRGYKAAEQQG